MAVWSPSGPTGLGGRSRRRSSRAMRRVTSSVGTSSPCGLLDHEGADALLGAGHDQDPVGACGRRAPPASVPVQPPRPPTCGWPGCGCGRPRRRGPPRRRATVPRVTPEASDAQPVVQPERDRRPWWPAPRRTGRARGAAAGPSPPARPSCRPGPCPGPPCSSGTSRPIQPRSTSCRPDVVGHAGVVLEHRPHVGRRRPVGQELPGGRLQGLLVVVEGELHGP